MNQQLMATWRASFEMFCGSRPAVAMNTGAPDSGLMIGSSVSGTIKSAGSTSESEGRVMDFLCRPGTRDVLLK